ncbi:conjugal transfer protein TraU [Pelomonas sp. HMWF004]|nr:conjugal transfer protein TraU [Pelomonas sp. HMWF004]
MFAASPSAFSQDSCTGAFPNIISDVCWDCMFPISLAGGLINIGISNPEDYDTGVNGSPVCICANSLSVGTPVSMWEPRYMVDATNTPGCFPLLGGLKIPVPYNSSEYGTIKHRNAAIEGNSKSAFMHANEYLNPIMSAIGIIVASPCLDNRSFDIPFFSWADPTWNDDSLALILTPYAYAFSGMASIVAEAPDAIQATFSLPNQYLFWVAGSWGPMYPLTGNVSVANSQEQVTHLLLARLFAKLHAAGVEQTTAGQDSLNSCGAMGVPELIMDKRQYKTNRTFPFPDNQCTPIGRPLTLQQIGAQRPTDKDYGYFIFQRKDCCQPLRSAGG